MAVVSWWIVPEDVWLKRRSLVAMVEESEPTRKDVENVKPVQHQ